MRRRNGKGEMRLKICHHWFERVCRLDGCVLPERKTELSCLWSKNAVEIYTRC